MINHKDKFDKVKETMKDLEEEYEIFRKCVTYSNRCSLKVKVKKHRDAVTQFVASVDNIFLK